MTSKPSYHDLERLLADERLRRARAEAHEALLVARINETAVIPDYDEVLGAECPLCRMALEPDYYYCPCCGCKLDWNPQPDEHGDDSAYDRWAGK